MLKDQDRIFKNLYNDLGSDVASSQKRGDWVNTKELTNKGRDWIINEIKDSQLRGRGGAGFPTGLKWSFAPKEIGSRPHYLVINGDESEPGTCKDRDILRFEPHKLIEGCLIASYAIQAHVCYIYIRGEYFVDGQKLQAAIDEAYEKKLLGKNAAGTGWDLDIYIHYGAGAYICGEETALLESIEGKKGQPRFKPPFPASHGLFGRPTTINNTETFAAVPWIINNGGDAYSKMGIPNNGGTKIFSVSGDVKKPGNYEVRLGTPFAELLKLAGGMKDEKKLKAVIPGGSSAPVLPSSIIMNTNMDYDSIAKAGSMLGSGAVIIMNEDRCMVESLLRLSYFYHEESYGQCTPCREGTGWLYRIVKKIKSGDAKFSDLESLKDTANNIGGRTICALGDAAALPVKGFLNHFHDEFKSYIKA